MELLMKLIKKQEITEKDIEGELYEICEREHSSCNFNCPCFKICHKGEGDCLCFKSGKKMLEAIRKELNEGKKE